MASVFYNSTSGDVEEGKIAVESLVGWQWIGFATCIFSTLSSIVLTSIHESIIENSSDNEVKNKQKELKEND